jgi:hypothetical protein
VVLGDAYGKRTLCYGIGTFALVTGIAGTPWLILVAGSRRDGAISMRTMWCAGLVLLLAALTCTPLEAHATSDMHEVEELATAWVNAVLSIDEQALLELLAEDATADMDLANQVHFASGAAFVAYLTPMLHEFAAHDINRERAFFVPHDTDVSVGPLLSSHGSGANILFAWFLDMHETPAGWKIRHVTVNLDGVPRDLVHGARPEQHPGRLIHFKVLDQASGQAIASRVSIHDAAGGYWPPQGHQYEIPTGWREDVGGDVKIGADIFAYVEPEFDVALPAGRYRIEVHHGFEYLARTLEFEIGSETAAVAVPLERWIDLNAAGWYSGDTHVHFVRPRAALSEARGEGLNVVNILAARWGNLITNVDDFSGGPDPVSGANNIIYVNEEARHLYLGHTALLGLKQLVFPLSWGSGPLTGVPGGSDYPPMANIADAAHRRGGFVTWAHFPGPRGEVAVDIALNKIDSVDVFVWGDPLARKAGEPSRVDAWYGFLNCGFRLPVTAGTDKMFNYQVMGTPRVYVQVDGRFTYDAWLDGIRQGRTFATTGPVVSMDVDGQRIGSTLERAAGSTVMVRAQAQSKLPISRLEIVQNGIVVATAQNPTGSDKIVLEAKLKIRETSWLAARVMSDATLPYQPFYLDRSEDLRVFAHTSPVYVDVPGSARRSARDAELFVRWIDQGLDWVRNHAVIPEPAERAEMIALFERARAVYAAQVAGGAPVRAP